MGSHSSGISLNPLISVDIPKLKQMLFSVDTKVESATNAPMPEEGDVFGSSHHEGLCALARHARGSV
jgi:hypothetical protein